MLVIALAKGERVLANIDALRRLGGDLTLDQYQEVISKCRISNGLIVNDKVDRVMGIIRSRQLAGIESSTVRRERKNNLNTTSTQPQQSTQQSTQQNEGILNPKSYILKPKTQSLSDTSDTRTKRGRTNSSAIHWTKDLGWIGITETDRTEWTAAYPNCVINQTLAQMHAWLRANPSKAHKSNWLRFITNWFMRTRENGGNVRAVRRQTESNF